MPHYDVVVVGSGYGGSIAACRLSRAGRKVAVLERGRELHPGEYPATTDQARRHVQVSLGDRDHEDPRDLFWFHAGGDVNVLSGCGLGGTSLINANVALRADPRVFEDDCWPHALQVDRAGMDAAYARAERMLSPTPYPATFPPLAKMEALRSAADGPHLVPDAHQRHLPRRAQRGRRAPGGVHRVRRLRDRVQLRRQEHPPHELPARRRGPRRARLHRGRCALD